MKKLLCIAIFLGLGFSSLKSQTESSFTIRNSTANTVAVAIFFEAEGTKAGEIIEGNFFILEPRASKIITSLHCIQKLVLGDTLDTKKGFRIIGTKVVTSSWGPDKRGTSISCEEHNFVITTMKTKKGKQFAITTEKHTR